MIKNTVYIAGKVTGLPYQEVYAKFKVAQLELEHKGYQVINPCEITPSDADWNIAMRTCISALCNCQFIYLLPCWTESKGATIERSIAITLGISTIEQ